MASALTGLSPFPWGKTHKDKPMEDVPAKYLLWLWDKDGGLWEEQTNLVAIAIRNYIIENASSLLREDKDTILEHPIK